MGTEDNCSQVNSNPLALDASRTWYTPEHFSISMEYCYKGLIFVFLLVGRRQAQ